MDYQYTVSSIEKRPYMELSKTSSAYDFELSSYIQESQQRRDESFLKALGNKLEPSEHGDDAYCVDNPTVDQSCGIEAIHTVGVDAVDDLTWARTAFVKEDGHTMLGASGIGVQNSLGPSIDTGLRALDDQWQQSELQTTLGGEAGGLHNDRSQFFPPQDAKSNVTPISCNKQYTLGHIQTDVVRSSLQTPLWQRRLISKQQPIQTAQPCVLRPLSLSSYLNAVFPPMTVISGSQDCSTDVKFCDPCAVSVVRPDIPSFRLDVLSPTYTRCKMDTQEYRVAANVALASLLGENGSMTAMTTSDLSSRSEEAMHAAMPIAPCNSADLGMKVSALQSKAFPSKEGFDEERNVMVENVRCEKLVRGSQLQDNSILTLKRKRNLSKFMKDLPKRPLNGSAGEINFPEKSGLYQFTPASSESTTEVRYICPYKACVKDFSTSGHARRHSRVHLNVRPFQCPHEGCYSKFTRRDNCIQHQRARHQTQLLAHRL